MNADRSDEFSRVGHLSKMSECTGEHSTEHTYSQVILVRTQNFYRWTWAKPFLTMWMGAMLTKAIEFWIMQWLMQIEMKKLMYVDIFLMKEIELDEVLRRRRIKSVKSII